MATFLEENWPLLLAGALSVFTGIASASLAVSAFSILLPVLINALEMRPVDALFVTFTLDAINGLLIFLRYRTKLAPNEHYKPMIVIALVSCGIACGMATLVGIKFLTNGVTTMKLVVISVDFFMASVFLFKYIRLRKSRNRKLDAELPAPAMLVAGVNLEEAREKREYDQDDQEEGSSFFNQILCGTVQVKYVVSVAFVCAIAAVGGGIGFGGGNAFAVHFIVIYQWHILSSTGASGLISGCVTLSLLVLYLALDVVDLDKVKTPLAVSVPCDTVAVLVASKLASLQPERTITLLVALLFFTMGIFATVYFIIYS